MRPNPNPNRITDQLWAYWLCMDDLEPNTILALGGTYANKKGYHNTRAANMTNWPGNYSYANYAADREGPPDKSAAIDLTFRDAQAGNYTTIKRYSGRLLTAGRNHDPRTVYLREFYGQADDDTGVEGWDYQRHGPASSDTSHLWHIHQSFIRKWVTSPKAFRAILSVMRGETLAQWRDRETSIVAANPGYRVLRQGLRGPDVAYLQGVVKVRDDGVFGPVTEAAVKAYQADRGLADDGVVGPRTWAFALVS